MLKEEISFGIKKYQTYKKFGEKVYKIRENVLLNIKKDPYLKKELIRPTRIYVKEILNLRQNV